jgi:hypothetical protein
MGKIVVATLPGHVLRAPRATLIVDCMDVHGLVSKPSQGTRILETVRLFEVDRPPGLSCIALAGIITIFVRRAISRWISATRMPNLVSWTSMQLSHYLRQERRGYRVLLMLHITGIFPELPRTLSPLAVGGRGAMIPNLLVWTQHQDAKKKNKKKKKKNAPREGRGEDKNEENKEKQSRPR